MKKRFDLEGRIDGMKRTPQGGLALDATLTRTGVFTYHNADGTTSRELRHPDKIFDAGALDTLRFAPVIVGHPSMVTPENYKELNVGVAAHDVRADGKYVKATVLIQDAATIERVLKKELVEISLGYEVEVKPASGEYEGETYDSEQTGHKYNHVALGPANWGRAGSTVRLHLDAAGDVVVDSYPPHMTVKADDTADQKARLDAVTGERDALKIALDAMTAKCDATAKALAEATARVGSFSTHVAPAEIPALVAKRAALENSARKVLGADAPLTKKDSDGKEVAMSDSDVMIAVLTKQDPKFDAKDKSADYVRACFDMGVKTSVKVDTALATVNAASSPQTKVDSANPNGKSRLDTAIDNAETERKTLAQAGPPPGARVRKA